MSKHTQGPWIVSDDELSDYFLVGPHDGDGIVYQPVVKLHSEANARLIAAAPDLLLALLGALQSMESGVTSLGVISAARAAIAKATGEQP